jgi:hypothetical protein
MTADGDLFCGDLLDNLSAPTFNTIMTTLQPPKPASKN